MNTRISGIPCQVLITCYYPARHANFRGTPDRWTPPEPEEISFQVLDWRGRPAPWLEEKLTEDDRVRIERELSDYIKREREMGDY